MSKKLEVLNAVRVNIEKNGIIAHQYHDGECYCAVGYVLKELGVSDFEMDVLATARIDFALTPGATPVPNDLSKRLASLMLDAGFQLEELLALQTVNDNTRYEKAILAQIDLMEKVVSR